MDTFDQLTANRRHNPQNSSSAQSWQCNKGNTQRGKPSQQQQPSQGPDNAKMERMKHISAAQNELYDRILTQYYMPLQLYIKAKDPKTVTLAEHTRLYKLGKLMETLSLSCQVQNKIVSWYSSVSGNLTNDFNNSLQRTLDDMEKATTAIDDHWSCKGVSPEADPTSFTEKLGLDPIKSKSAGSSTLLAVDMTTIEDRITNLHTSLESALNSLKRMIHTAQTEHVPLSNLDLSESDLGMLLLTLPLPYGGQEGWIAAK